MKIVLAEERNGQQLAEQSFELSIVKIGRDPNECQIVFDRSQFPMVSRQHAEFRWVTGRWILVDNNSSYGTFLNEKRIAEPQILSFGSKIQFGTNGPVLKVIWLQMADAIEPQISQNRIQNQPAQQKISQPIPPQRPIQPSAVKTVSLEFIDSGSRPNFVIAKDSIVLGRESVCDVVIETSAAMVSRKHAEIKNQNGQFILFDNGSFNGTLLNEQRITTPTLLKNGDVFELGIGGPKLRFVNAAEFSTSGKTQSEEQAPKTMMYKAEDFQQSAQKIDQAQVQILFQKGFDGKQILTIGRGESNDISLDGLQISNRHAKLTNNGNVVSIEDVGSTNGTYVNGKRITKQQLTPNDTANIGSFQIKIDQAGNVIVLDSRSKTRIDALNISKEVRNRAGGGKIKLLDNVSLSIQPNEFIGLLGPSGAGKSTLMDALNGMRPASSGNVLVNNIDLYDNLDSLKQGIGYVPQDDIIHRELTVYRTLYYVAKLRLSRDISSKEIEQIVSEVMDVTGLTERRDVPVSQLSGGQRKRVSIAVELVTKPSVIYLDEPTSGLDPATEEKIMRLFRQIAESGRTVILTTHAMENVKLFDKIVVLMRGKLAFYGKPHEALTHFGAESFKELYDKLEAPIDQQLSKISATSPDYKQQRQQVTENVADGWKNKFTQTPQFQKNVHEPLLKLQASQATAKPRKRRLGIFGSIRQTLTLSRRYFEVLLKDRLNLLILLAQAPIIALMTFVMVGKDQPRDFVFFVLSLVAIWFGISISAREIIRERPVYNRERMVNLGILPYLFSKLLILGIIVSVQCLFIFVPMKFLDLIGLMKMQGEFLGVPQFGAMILTSAVGIGLGILISSIVKTSEMATSLVPLILIPQIIFSGVFGVPHGISKVVGLTMPATWSFDTIKRFSSLDTLREEGAYQSGRSNGRGLYNFVEEENDKIIADAKKNADDYKDQMQEYVSALQRGNTSLSPPQNPPKVKDAIKLPKDLSNYVEFLHPWMSEILNQLVLMIMFLGLFLATVIVLKTQDIG